MSSKSNDKGRAYEYAWIQVLYSYLKRERPVRVIHNSSFEANKRAWSTLTGEEQNNYSISAESAVGTIRNSGANSMDRKKQMAETTAVKPVRPPASTPLALST